MSGASDNRSWRQRLPPQPSHQRGGSGTNTPTGRQDSASNRQSMSAYSGNAWAAADRSRSGSHTGERARGAGAAAGAALQENHVPVRDFNSQDVREFLRKSYLDASNVAPEAGTPHYKPQGDSVPNRNSGVWSQKQALPHQMPNGQDFFTQLRKQIQALDSSKTA